jgi:uncharacterized protein YqiB (DUF1249 family)
MMNTIVRQETLSSRKLSFAALMVLYEENYTLACRLIPRHWRRKQAISRSSDDLSLHLRCISRDKFTTLYLMTYYIDERAEPGLIFRLYHDAVLAEAVGFSGHAPTVDHMDEMTPAWVFRHKWQLNLFLNKWLRYCLGRGHGFFPHATSKSQSF